MDAQTLASMSLETLQTWLGEALAARHQLALGKLTSLIQWGENRQQYNAANAAELESYIAALQSAISARSAGRSLRAPLVIGF